MSGFHRRMGAFEIGRVEEVVCPLTQPRQWFGDCDQAVLREALAALPAGYYDPTSQYLTSSFHSWVLRVGGKTILIDTCSGNHKDRPSFPIFHMLNQPYLQRLKDIGVRPEDVDVVMCTHLHGDHVGWNTQLGDGRWVPTFPNARYLMGRRELEWFQAHVTRPDTAALEVNTYNDSVLPVVEAEQVELVGDDAEIVPGLRIWPTPGHTPGHLGVKLESGGERALFCGDALHFPLQIPLWHWPTLVDKDPAQGAATRGEIVKHCAEKGALLLPAHFLAPYGGYVSERAEQFSISFDGVR